MLKNKNLFLEGNSGIKLSSFNVEDSITLSGPGDPVYEVVSGNPAQTPSITVQDASGKGMQFTALTRQSTRREDWEDGENPYHKDILVTTVYRIEILNPGSGYKNPIFYWKGRVLQGRGSSIREVTRDGSFAPPINSYKTIEEGGGAKILCLAGNCGSFRRVA